MQFSDTIRAVARGATVLAFVAAAAAGAQTSEGVTVDASRDTVTNTKVVRYGDLDLTSNHGRRELDRRIKVAVNDVCDVWDISPAREHTEFKRCSRATLESARAQVDERSASTDAVGIVVSKG